MQVTTNIRHHTKQLAKAEDDHQVAVESFEAEKEALDVCSIAYSTDHRKYLPLHRNIAQCVFRARISNIV